MFFTIGMCHNLDQKWMLFLEQLLFIGLNQIKSENMKFYVLSTVALDTTQ